MLIRVPYTINPQAINLDRIWSTVLLYSDPQHWGSDTKPPGSIKEADTEVSATRYFQGDPHVYRGPSNMRYTIDFTTVSLKDVIRFNPRVTRL